MNVEDKLRTAIKNFEEAERLRDRAQLQFEESQKELTLTRERLAKAMHATGESMVWCGNRTYEVRFDKRDDSNAVSVIYTEFTGRILQ